MHVRLSHGLAGHLCRRRAVRPVHLNSDRSKSSYRSGLEVGDEHPLLRSVPAAGVVMVVIGHIYQKTGLTFCFLSAFALIDNAGAVLSPLILGSIYSATARTLPSLAWFVSAVSLPAIDTTLAVAPRYSDTSTADGFFSSAGPVHRCCWHPALHALGQCARQSQAPSHAQEEGKAHNYIMRSESMRNAVQC